VSEKLNEWAIFNDKYKELCEWLTQMENKVAHSAELNIEEMVEKLKKVRQMSSNTQPKTPKIHNTLCSSILLCFAKPNFEEQTFHIYLHRLLPFLVECKQANKSTAVNKLISRPLSNKYSLYRTAWRRSTSSVRIRHI